MAGKISTPAGLSREEALRALASDQDPNVRAEFRALATAQALYAYVLVRGAIISSTHLPQMGQGRLDHLLRHPGLVADVRTLRISFEDDGSVAIDVEERDKR